MATIEAILLTPVKNKGRAGDVVKLRRGYFLYLQRNDRAVYATAQARQNLEKQREELQKKDEVARQEALVWAGKLDQKIVRILGESSDTGVLYGSVSTRDIARHLAAEGLVLHPNQIGLPEPLKQVGQHTVRIDLHPTVHADIVVSIESGHASTV